MDIQYIIATNYTLSLQSDPAGTTGSSKVMGMWQHGSVFIINQGIELTIELTLNFAVYNVQSEIMEQFQNAAPE